MCSCTRVETLNVDVRLGEFERTMSAELKREMAKKSAPAIDAPAPANLTAEALRTGIPKIRRRRAELDEIHVDPAQDLSNEATRLTNKINATLRDFFGVLVHRHGDRRRKPI